MLLGLTTVQNNNQIKVIDAITGDLIKCKHLSEFELLLEEHEAILSSILNQTPVQQLYFKDYFGVVKSLGAWGGDFILATGNDDTPFYFANKGFKTIIPYKEMVL